jgi:hypothetical protein
VWSRWTDALDIVPKPSFRLYWRWRSLRLSVPPFKPEAFLGGAADENLPSEQEKMVSAKGAPMGYQDPQESPFGGISGADRSKLDGPAM